MRPMRAAELAGNVPAFLYHRLGLGVLVPFCILTGASALLLSHLSFSPDIGNLLPPKDRFIASQQAFESHFASPSYATVLLTSTPLFSRRSLAAISHLGHLIAENPDVSSVLSAATVKDIEMKDASMRFRSLYDGGHSTAAIGSDQAPSVRKAILGTPLFRSFLVSRDGKSLVLYVFPKHGARSDSIAREVFGAMGKVRSGGISTMAFGMPIVEYYTKRATQNDLLLLGLISLIVAVTLESLVTRSLLVGLVLLLSSAVPTLWSLSLFPLFGVRVSVYTMIVPLMVFSLSTSYSIHLFRSYSALEGRAMEGALRSTTPVVLVAGGTTMLGFLSLAFAPIAVLRTLGLLVLPGIFFSMVTALFLLPALLSLHRMPVRVRPSRSGKTAMGGQRRATLLVSSFALLMGTLLVGATMVQYDFQTGHNFRPSTRFGSLVRSYSQKNGGVQELVVAIDTGKEYGLVDPTVFKGIRSIVRTIHTVAPQASLLSFTEFVDWMDSRLAPKGTHASSVSSAKIGEDLEMLFSADSGLKIDSLVDPSYRRTRIIVHYQANSAPMSSPTSSYQRLKKAIRTSMRADLPSSTRLSFYGTAEQYSHLLRYLVRSELYSALFFFATLFVLLLVGFRSLRWSLLVLLPPLSGFAFYFGVLGWLGVSFSPVTVFMLSAVMGVGNDDILFFALALRRRLREESLDRALKTTLRHTGRAIAQTTVVLAGGLSVLGLSQFTYVSREGLVGAATLCTCTLITYWIVPALMLQSRRAWTLRDKQEVI